MKKDFQKEWEMFDFLNTIDTIDKVIGILVGLGTLTGMLIGIPFYFKNRNKRSKSKKASASKNITAKRQILFEKSLDAAFGISRDILKQKLVSVVTILGMTFLGVKEISGDSGIKDTTLIVWLLGGGFFVVAILIALQENKKTVEYNSQMAEYYYNHDNPKTSKAKAEKEKLTKFGKKLEIAEMCSDFFFVLGIICAILSTCLQLIPNF